MFSVHSTVSSWRSISTRNNSINSRSIKSIVTVVVFERSWQVRGGSCQMKLTNEWQEYFCSVFSHVGQTNRRRNRILFISQRLLLISLFHLLWPLAVRSIQSFDSKETVFVRRWTWGMRLTINQLITSTDGRGKTSILFSSLSDLVFVFDFDWFLSHSICNIRFYSATETTTEWFVLFLFHNGLEWIRIFYDYVIVAVARFCQPRAQRHVRYMNCGKAISRRIATQFQAPDTIYTQHSII